MLLNDIDFNGFLFDFHRIKFSAIIEIETAVNCHFNELSWNVNDSQCKEKKCDPICAARLLGVRILSSTSNAYSKGDDLNS